MPPDFETLLQPGERLLWQGRPDATFTIVGGEWGSIILGLVLAAIIGTFGVMAARDGQSMSLVEMLCFGALIVAVAAAGPYYSFFERKNTWYALTSDRAIIYFDATPVGTQLLAYEVRQVEVVPSRAPGHRSVRIAYASQGQPFIDGQWRSGYSPHWRDKGRPYDFPVAFERISEADHVAKLAQAVMDGRK